MHRLMTVVNEVPAANQADANQNIRKLAAILFNNTLQRGVFPDRGQVNFQASSWFQLDQETRAQVKNMLLGTLGGDMGDRFTIQFLKDLCLCISAIAIIEIPTKEWNDYVQIMTNQALQNDNEIFKMAGILNLGNI